MRYGFLKVIGEAKPNQGHRVVITECDCGKVTNKMLSYLKKDTQYEKFCGDYHCPHKSIRNPDFKGKTRYEKVRESEKVKQPFNLDADVYKQFMEMR